MNIDNMKKRIRLSESDLHRVIKESVKRVINEHALDSDDYFYDEFYEMDQDNSRAANIARAIERGDYDDKLDKIVKYGPGDYFDIEAENQNYDWVNDAAHERKCLIDKDYAMKYGHNPDNPNWLSQAHRSHSASQERYGVHTNINRFNRKQRGSVLSDRYWQDKENREAGAKFPHTLKKNGSIRKGNDKLPNLKSNLEKDTIGTDQADKRPLHRKGSLNRG